MTNHSKYKAEDRALAIAYGTEKAKAQEVALDERRGKALGRKKVYPSLARWYDFK